MNFPVNSSLLTKRLVGWGVAIKTTSEKEGEWCGEVHSLILLSSFAILFNSEFFALRAEETFTRPALRFSWILLRSPMQQTERL